MKNYAVNIIESAAKMHGCTCEMKLMGAANSLTSSEALMERVKRVCEEDLHLPVAKEMSSKNGGSEDVSYMMNRVQEQGGQATFMRVLTHEAWPGSQPYLRYRRAGSSECSEDFLRCGL